MKKPITLLASAALAISALCAPSTALAAYGTMTRTIDLLTAPGTAQLESTGSTQTTPSNTAYDSALGEQKALTISPDGHYALLTAPLKADLFHIAGVTWEGATPERIEVRVEDSGTWSEWYALEYATDAGAANPAGSNTSNGTEPFINGGSTGIQVRALGLSVPQALVLNLSAGNGAEGSEQEVDAEPTDVLPTLGTDTQAPGNAQEIDSVLPLSAPLTEPLHTDTTQEALPPALETTPTPTAEEETLPAADVVTADPAAAPASHNFARIANAFERPTSSIGINGTRLAASAPVPQPAITPRTSWADGMSLNQYAPEGTFKLQGAIVHHTAGTNDYTAAQSPSIIRGMWNYHAITLGWGDIGYNFVIDKFGNIYEGRYGSLTSAPGYMSRGAHAIGVNQHAVGISVMGTYMGNVQPSSAVITSISNVIAWQFSRAGISPTASYAYTSTSGATKYVGTIGGHQEINATACPGNIQNFLPQIRTLVASIINGAHSGDSILPHIHYVSSSQVGMGWPAHNSWTVGDYVVNGYADMLLRTENGDLFIYEGLDNNVFAAPRKIGNGWNIFSQLYTGVDFNSDGFTDILGLTPTGELWLYAGYGNGTMGIGTKIGWGWSSFSRILAVAHGPNMNPALYALHKDGKLSLYPTDGLGGFLTSHTLSGNYAKLRTSFAVSDWNRDGYSDLLAVEANGHLMFMPGSENGPAQATHIGNGWGSFTMIGAQNQGADTMSIYSLSSNGLLYSYSWKATR